MNEPIFHQQLNYLFEFFIGYDNRMFANRLNYGEAL